MAAYLFLVELPLPISIAVIVLPLLALTIVLIVLLGRRDQDVRANDNVATAAIRLVGGAFIFVSAFSTAAIWQESNHVAQTIGGEFGHASVFANHMAAQELPEGSGLIRELRAYTDVVMSGELINAQVTAAEGEDGAEVHVRNAVRGVIDLEDQNKIDSSDSKVLLDALASMTTARGDRLSQPYPILPLPVFVLVLSLGILTIVIAAAYPSGPDRRLKWLQALTAFAVVASLLSTALFLLNGDSGWSREQRLGPAELFMEESTALGAP